MFRAGADLELTRFTVPIVREQALREYVPALPPAFPPTLAVLSR